VERLTEQGPARGEVVVEGKVVPVPGDVAGELSRIAQEAVSNAIKHAEARHITVRLCYEEGGVQLSISDDGRGFDPDQAPGPGSGHFGLLGIGERAARLGQLSVESRPGQGTRIAVTVSAERASQDGDHV
jgi:signal transduction histidine kinase